jgi:acetylornithine deacetylase/succinyl-diaminopimelate desuccinylase-like protein
VSVTLERVRARVAERFPADLGRIRDYLRLPSVSATGEGIRAAAEATGAWIEGAGGTFELVETLGHPVVLGEAPPGNRSELALRSSYRALGRRPLPYPLAPWCAPYYVFDRILGQPWAAGGVGHAAGAHGPDEYATLAGLQEHVVGAAAFLLVYANGTTEAPA